MRDAAWPGLSKASPCSKAPRALLTATPCRPVLRYFRLAPPPFVYLTQAGGAGSVPAAQLARSTLRGLQLLPQLQWPVAAALPALLQHAEPDVRWCAAHCAALVFGLQDASCAQVRPAGSVWWCR